MADGQIAHAPTLAASRPTGPEDAEPGRQQRLAAGTAVGDYVIDRFLGAGAMGEVYEGHHPVIGKRVAVKVLKRELADKEGEAEARFVREARAVNVVDHPNVIDVFNFGRLDDGRMYLMMDLVDGKSLRRVLQDGELPVGEALDILGQIADALDAAHAKGVIHRDLKPDNVMLSGGTPAKVYVLDFGIAKLVSANATGHGTLTEKGSWLGTPGYMAPEQWSADGAGPASDRYALGVMAYEMLAGTLPFQAASLPQMMEQHFRAPVPALSTRRGTTGRPPEHHQTLDPVLARAMAKSPDARFPTARSLVEALRTAAKGTAVEAPSGGGKRSLVVPAAAGVGVLGLAIFGIVVVRGGKTDDGAAGDRTERPAGAPAQGGDGFVKLKVITMPDKARVMRDGQLVGRTPITVDVRSGGAVKLAISKPGFRPITEEVTPTKEETILHKELLPVTGFEGVWRMPDGKLRGFWRGTTGDKIDVYRLESVHGERALWRTCELEDPPAGSDGLVVFATMHEQGDERSTDATCSSIPHRIEYRYDPVAERLEVRAENVTTSKQADGTCIVVRRDPGKPTLLARAETSDLRTTSPPVGKVDFEAIKKAEIKKLEDAKKNVAPKVRPAPKQVPPAPKGDLGSLKTGEANLPPPQVDNKEQVQNNAPVPKAPPQQKTVLPAPQAQQPAPRGDAQQVQTDQAPRQKK
jgi:serine/threonine-protein kinase